MIELKLMLHTIWLQLLPIEDLIIYILLSFSILSCRPKVIGNLNIMYKEIVNVWAEV